MTLVMPLTTGISSADGTDTTGYQWGTPHSGSGTYPSNLQHSSPTAIAGIPNPVVQVVASNGNDYALDNTGAVWAWGTAKYGGLGTGSTYKQTYVATPVQVQFPGGVTIASLPDPMPFDTAMAIDTNGNAWGWGYNSFRQLCVSSTVITAPIELPLSNVSMASGAGDHAIYYSNGTLLACGANGYGDLGTGTKSADKTAGPVNVTGLPSENIKSVTTSWRNSGVLMSDGTYYDWGFGVNGQIGNGKSKSTDVPSLINLPQTVSQVSLGGSYYNNGQTIALLSDGSVWMWGNNTEGQLGNGSTQNSNVPTQVSVPEGVNFVFVNSGGASTFAIDNTGNAWSWGQNNYGQLGIGTTDGKSHTLPVSIGMDFNEISSTALNVIAL
jgi:alpha-tubulin suppressor-like RCC1 family protein